MMKGTMFVIENNKTTVVKFQGRKPTLNELQTAVHGPIELVPFFDQHEGRPCLAFCNELGKLNGMPVNNTATYMWQLAVAPRHLWDQLVGPVVVLTGNREFLESL